MLWHVLRGSHRPPRRNRLTRWLDTARSEGNHLYTWLVPKDLPDGYLEVHTFTVDSTGILYGGDNQYSRTQKFVPKSGADPKQLIWRAR